MSALGILSGDLDARLYRAPVDAKRAACLAAIQLAVSRSDFREPLAEAALLGLQKSSVFSDALTRGLAMLEEHLDKEYFDLKESAEKGLADPRAWQKKFAQARAVAALGFAGSGVEKVGEAIYEAAYALPGDGPEEVLALVDAVLARHNI